MVRKVKWTKYLWPNLLSFGAFTDFLLEHKLLVAQTIDAALDIILYGIEKENTDDK